MLHCGRSGALTLVHAAGCRWALARGAQPLPGSSNILPLPVCLQGGAGSSGMPAHAGVPAWASCVLPWLIMATGQLGARPETHPALLTHQCLLQRR